MAVKNGQKTVFGQWEYKLTKIQGFYEPLSKYKRKLKFARKNGREWPPPSPMFSNKQWVPAILW